MDILDRILFDLRRRKMVTDTQTLLEFERAWRDQIGGNKHWVAYRPGDLSRRNAAQCRDAGLVASDAASTIGVSRQWCAKLFRGA